MVPAEWRPSLPLCDHRRCGGSRHGCASGNDFHSIHRIVEGRSTRALFVGNKEGKFFLVIISENCFKENNIMMDNIKIDRINALAHKQKSMSLTEEEKGGAGEASGENMDAVKSLRAHLRQHRYRKGWQHRNLGEKYGRKRKLEKSSKPKNMPMRIGKAVSGSQRP